jgi:Domain of unknown function (DUF932)
MWKCVCVKANLILHCGAAKASRDQVFITPTPASTETWQPISHFSLLNQVEKSLGGNGLEIIEEAHGLSADGQRYFGLLQIGKIDDSNTEYAFVVGLRNSHDRRFTATLGIGSQVFCCDNLSFSSEIVVARKHTTFIERDLPGITARAVGQLADSWGLQDQRFAAYKARGLTDKQAHHTVIRLLDARAITTCQVPKVLKEYRHPRHAEFAEHRNAWRLFNAVTQVHQETGGGIWNLPLRTRALHGILDQECQVFGTN